MNFYAVIFLFPSRVDHDHRVYFPWSVRMVVFVDFPQYQRAVVGSLQFLHDPTLFHFIYYETVLATPSWLREYFANHVLSSLSFVHWIDTG